MLGTIRTRGSVTLFRVRYILALLLSTIWILTNFRMRSCVHILHFLSIDVVFDEFGEVSLILGGIFFLQHLHVFFHMLAENASLVGFSIIFVFLAFLFRSFVARKVFAAVRNMKTTIDSALQRTPHARADTCGTNTH